MRLPEARLRDVLDAPRVPFLDRLPPPLMRELQDYGRAYARKRGARWEDLDDLLQDVFKDLRQGEDLGTCPFGGAFCHRIHQRLRKLWKKRAAAAAPAAPRDLRLAECPAADGVDSGLLDADAKAAFDRAWARLSHRNQTLLSYALRARFAYADIARWMGYADAASVRSTVCRVYAELMQHYREELQR